MQECNKFESKEKSAISYFFFVGNHQIIDSHLEKSIETCIRLANKLQSCEEVKSPNKLF